MAERRPPNEVGILQPEGVDTYKVIVGNLEVTIDLVGQTVCVYRTDVGHPDLVTREAGNGFLIDLSADDREVVCGIEAIS